MRLINVHTMELEEYFDDAIPEYAILSHTWGKEEVTFQEWTNLFRHRKLEKRFGKSIEKSFEYMFASLELDTIHERSGYSKIVRCAEEARSNAINLTSSAELSEAINSMFRWYKNSVICYAYFSDVATLDGLEHEGSDFRKGRWFTRGWTLQELLAPDELVFFDQGWNGSRNKKNILDVISKITGIPVRYISGETFQSACVAQKMAWASRRRTTRKEDMAYCLLGIFEVNMPLLYDEGERAFTRLQEEIVKQTQDQSVFDSGLDQPANRDYSGGIFPRSPADFDGCRYIISLTVYNHSEPSQMTNKGLQIRLDVWSNEICPDFVYGRIECEDLTDTLMVPLIPLENKSIEDGDGFWRPPSSIPIRIRCRGHYSTEGNLLDCRPVMPITWKNKSITLYLKRDLTSLRHGFTFQYSTWPNFNIEGIPLLSPHTFLKEIFPHNCWLEGNQIFQYQPYTQVDIDRVFLRFHSLRERTDSVVVFQSQNLRGKFFMKSNIVSWDQIHSYRQEMGKDISSVAELFWNDPNCLLDDFWLRDSIPNSHVLRVDLTSDEPLWIFNISRRVG